MYISASSSLFTAQSISFHSRMTFLLPFIYFTYPTSLQSYLHLFNSTLLSILDNHAPLKTVTCSARPNKPFITPEILSQKSKRSKLETIYHRTKTPESRNSFKSQAKLVAKLISASKHSIIKL